MITFNYQGQDIQAEVIDELNAVRGEGQDTLLRSEEGRYYLQRETHHPDFRYFEALEDPEASSYWRTAHRLSLGAAILWTIGNKGTNLPLRQDAAERLRQTGPGRTALDWLDDLGAFGWLDDHAAKLVGEHLAEQPALDLRDLLNGALRFYLEDSDKPECPWSTSGEAVEEATRFRLAANGDDAAPELPALRRASTRFYPAGGMDLTFHLAPPVARMVQVICDMQEEETTPALLIYENMADFVAEVISQGEEPEKSNLLGILHDHAPTGEEEAAEEADGSLLLRLDAEAAEKLRAYRRITARELDDIATGAVMLSVDMALDHADQTREPDWYLLADEVEEAAARRLEAGTLPAAVIPAKHDSREAMRADAFTLEPFFLKLLDAFCNRWDIDPAVFVRAAVQEKLESLFSTHEDEYTAARCLRESGDFHGRDLEALNEQAKVNLYVQAGLDISEWIDGDSSEHHESEEEKEVVRVTTRQGDFIADVELAPEVLTYIEEHAKRHGMDFQEAFCDVLRIGLDTRELTEAAAAAADSVADLPSAEDADDAPFVVRDLRRLPSLDRPDAAPAAAASVLPPPPPPLAEDEQGAQPQPEQEGGK